jgi:hypothetical protein
MIDWTESIAFFLICFVFFVFFVVSSRLPHGEA